MVIFPMVTKQLSICVFNLIFRINLEFNQSRNVSESGEVVDFRNCFPHSGITCIVLTFHGFLLGFPLVLCGIPLVSVDSPLVSLVSPWFVWYPPGLLGIPPVCLVPR